VLNLLHFGVPQVQRSRCTMFGMAPVPASGILGDTPGSSSAGAATGHPELDTWVDKEVDLPARMSLRQLTPDKRATIAWTVKKKCETGLIRGNPSAYIQGCVRKELNSDMSAFGTSRSDFHMHYPVPTDGQQAPMGTARAAPYSPSAAPISAAVQTMASPQRAATPAPERPPWICQAWSCHKQRAALFRTVSRSVPPEAMEAIADLPGDWQLICLQVLLINKHNYSDPVVFMQNFAQGYRSMPSSGAQIPANVAAPRGVGRAVVVLHLGKSSGFELHALQIAAERLVTENHQVHIAEIAMIDNDAARNVADDILTSSNNSGPSVIRINPKDSARQVCDKAMQWRDQGAAVVVSIVVPKPMPSGLPVAAQAPGYHAGSARELWSYVHLLKILAMSVSRVGVVVFTPKREGPESADDAWFNKHFGQAMVISHEHLRIPQNGWIFRCGPAAQPLAPTARKLAVDPLNQYLDPELAAAADPARPFTAVLPDLLALEDLVEKRMSGDLLSEGEKKSLNLLLRRTSLGLVEEPAKLLDRTALMHIFGVTGWRVLDSFSEKMPCSSHVHPFTGQAVAATFPGAVPCGQPRYCPACCALYECIMSTPSPFVYSHGIAIAVGTAHFCTEYRAGVDFAALPSHHCEVGCLGHSS